MIITMYTGLNERTYQSRGEYAAHYSWIRFVRSIVTFSIRLHQIR